jgi:hypothetical protein
MVVVVVCVCMCVCVCVWWDAIYLKQIARNHLLSRVALRGARACAILAAVAESTQDAHHENCLLPRCKEHGDLWCGTRAMRCGAAHRCGTHTLLSQTVHVDTRWRSGSTSSVGHSQCGAVLLQRPQIDLCSDERRTHAGNSTHLFECECVKTKVDDACNDIGDGCSERYRLEATTMRASDVGEERSGELRTPATHGNPHPRTPACQDLSSLEQCTAAAHMCVACASGEHKSHLVKLDVLILEVFASRSITQ